MLLFIIVGWLIHAHAEWDNCGCYQFLSDSKVQSCVYSYYGCNNIKIINERKAPADDLPDLDEDEDTNFALRQQAMTRYGWLRQDQEPEQPAMVLRTPSIPLWTVED